MKNILGLDLGTNSIGWAVVNGSVNDNGSEQLVKIQASGSRIIPMDAAMIGILIKVILYLKLPKEPDCVEFVV